MPWESQRLSAYLPERAGAVGSVAKALMKGVNSIIPLLIAMESLSLFLPWLGWLLFFEEHHVSRVKEALWNVLTRASPLMKWDNCNIYTSHGHQKGHPVSFFVFSLASVPMALSVTLQTAKSDCWPTPKNPLVFFGLVLYQFPELVQLTEDLHECSMGLWGWRHEPVEHISLPPEIQGKMHAWRLLFFQLCWLISIQNDTSPYKLVCFILRPFTTAIWLLNNAHSDPFSH